MSRPADLRRQAIERLRELALEGVDGLEIEGFRSGRPGRSRRPGRPGLAERRSGGARTGALKDRREVTGGVETTASSADPGRQEASSMPAPRSPVSVTPSVPAARPADETGRDDWSALDLQDLRTHLKDCSRCGLCEARTHVVFGSGAADARLMFVGEGPGRDEDLAGEPFVGAAGSLLTDMIEKGLKLRRADVYIANVVKCRPPGNRNPDPAEIAACRPFLERQVDLVRPEVIVALGKFAAQVLTGEDAPISRLRGRWHQHRGVALMPTFHPAYLLREPARKRDAWQDLKQVIARLGLGEPPR